MRKVYHQLFSKNRQKIEVIQELVLPEVSKLYDPVMKKVT